MKQIFFTAAATFLLSRFEAHAQTAPVASTGTQRVTMAIDDILDLSWTTGSGTAQIFSFSNINDYTNGKESPEQEFIIRSNKKFKIEVKTTNPNLSDGSTNQMPVANHLKMMVTSNTTGAIAGSWGTSYNNLSHVPQQIVSGGQPGSENNPEQKFRIRYRAVPGTTYPKGNYMVDVLFTATHQ